MALSYSTSFSPTCVFASCKSRAVFIGASQASLRPEPSTSQRMASCFHNGGTRVRLPSSGATFVAALRNENAILRRPSRNQKQSPTCRPGCRGKLMFRSGSMSRRPEPHSPVPGPCRAGAEPTATGASNRHVVTPPRLASGALVRKGAAWAERPRRQTVSSLQGGVLGCPCWRPGKRGTQPVPCAWRGRGPRACPAPWSERGGSRHAPALAGPSHLSGRWQRCLIHIGPMPPTSANRFSEETGLRAG